MPPQLAAVLVVLAVSATTTMLSLAVVRAMCRRTFGPLAAAFPPREPAPDAVRRSFQSFSVGLINGGWSYHAAADEHHLHLRPTALVRWFGAAAMSIPWGEIRLEPGRGWVRRARVRGIKIVGPRWCMDLAGDRPA